MKFIQRLALPRIITRSIVAEKKGQSLLEFALILPILLIMLLGVFEVGYALRSYLALANVNREATRFAARGIYLDFDEKVDPNKVGYEKVVSHTIQSLASQLPLDMFGSTPNSVELITFYRIEPKNFGCPGDTTCASFDCNRFDYEHRKDANFVTGETLNDIEYPYLWTSNVGDPNLPSYYRKVLTMANTTPITAFYYYQGANSVYSKINPADMVLDLRSRSNFQNCQLLKKKLTPTKSDYIVIENIFFQKPIVGLLPFIGDTIPMYTHTVMRVTSNIREAPLETTDTCELYPIMIPASKLSGLNQGDKMVFPVSNSHDVPGNFGFVHWNAIDSNGSTGSLSTSLPNNLLNPGNAAKDFQEPGSDSPGPIDTQINLGDWVEAYTGVNSAVQPELDQLAVAGKYMRVPVWYDGDCNIGGGGCTQATGSGNNAKYRVMTFAVMKITDSCLQNSHDCDTYTGDKQIEFVFDRFEPNGCTGDSQ